jgi:DNA-binding transcriptional LysR family regulator
MDLKRLHAFYFVGKYGTVTKAANYLKLTPAAISLQLKKLESELRVKIFERHPNKLALTERGRVLFKEANHVFEAVTRMEEAVSHNSSRYSGKLTIALGSDLPAFFAPRIAAFSQKHPHLRISILSRSSRDTLSLLLAGDVDVGIGSFQKPPPGVQKKRLMDRKVYLAFSSSHALAQKKKISLKDIATSRLILHTSGAATRRLIDSGFAGSGIETDNILEVGTCESILDFVRLGLGVGFVHDTCLPRLPLRNLHLLNMTKQFGTTELSILYKESNSSNAASEALTSTLATLCRKI